MREIAWTVLPMPISSARIPPFTAVSSCASIHPRPSSWNGSSGWVSSGGDGWRKARLGPARKSASSGLTSFSMDFGLSFRVISRRTALRSAALASAARPCTLGSSAAAVWPGTRAHARWAQKLPQPKGAPMSLRPHLVGTPTLISPFPTLVQHIRHLPRLDLAYSTRHRYSAGASASSCGWPSGIQSPSAVIVSAGGACACGSRSRVDAPAGPSPAAFLRFGAAFFFPPTRGIAAPAAGGRPGSRWGGGRALPGPRTPRARLPPWERRRLLRPALCSLFFFFC